MILRLLRKLFLCCFLFAYQAVVPQNLDSTLLSLSTQSSYIVHGRAESMKSHYNQDSSWIFTDVTFKVIDWYRGSQKNHSLIISLPFGTLDGNTMLISEAPVFFLEEETILFLQKVTDKKNKRYGKYIIPMLSQGKFNIYEVDGIKKVFKDGSTGLNYSKHAPEQKPICDLADFKNRIKQFQRQFYWRTDDIEKNHIPPIYLCLIPHAFAFRLSKWHGFPRFVSCLGRCVP